MHIASLFFVKSINDLILSFKLSNTNKKAKKKREELLPGNISSATIQSFWRKLVTINLKFYFNLHSVGSNLLMAV